VGKSLSLSLSLSLFLISLSLSLSLACSLAKDPIETTQPILHLCQGPRVDQISGDQISGDQISGQGHHPCPLVRLCVLAQLPFFVPACCAGPENSTKGHKVTQLVSSCCESFDTTLHALACLRTLINSLMASYAACKGVSEKCARARHTHAPRRQTHTGTPTPHTTPT